MPKYFSNWATIAILVVLASPSFAQQTIEKYEIPAPLQPAPEIPNLSDESVSKTTLGKTFSILEQDAISRVVPGDGGNDSGTFAVTKQDSQNPRPNPGFGSPGSFPSSGFTGDSPANSSPALSPLRPNELRQKSQDPQPNTNPSPLRDSFGDSRLRYDQAPIPPQPENAQSGRLRPQDNSQRSFNFPSQENRFDRSTGNALPPVNQTPDQNIRRTGQAPISNQNQVRPVEYQEVTPREINRELVDMTLAKELMNRYSIDGAPDPLPGQPTKLNELLQTTSSRNRLNLVSQYWQTHQDWAMLLNSAEQLKWLNQFPMPRAPSDKILLNAAKASAENQVLEAEIRLSESQSALQQLAMSNPSQLLPLPSDSPLLQTFHTHYEYYTQRESLPQILKSIDNSLPKMLQLIANRAQTARMANSALNQNRSAFANGQTTLASVLEAARIWKKSEEQLIQTVTKYNISTAKYAINFRPGQTNEKLITMLIAKPKPIVESSSIPSRTADASLLNSARTTNNQPRFGNPTVNERLGNRQRNQVDLGPLPGSSRPGTDFGKSNRPAGNNGFDNSFGSPATNNRAKPPANGNKNGFGFGN